MMSLLSSFAQHKTINISRRKRDILKRKTPFFFTLKSLSGKQQSFKTILSFPLLHTIHHLLLAVTGMQSILTITMKHPYNRVSLQQDYKHIYISNENIFTSVMETSLQPEYTPTSTCNRTANISVRHVDF